MKKQKLKNILLYTFILIAYIYINIYLILLDKYFLLLVFLLLSVCLIRLGEKAKEHEYDKFSREIRRQHEKRLIYDPKKIFSPQERKHDIKKTP